MDESNVSLLLQLKSTIESTKENVKSLNSELDDLKQSMRTSRHVPFSLPKGTSLVQASDLEKLRLEIKMLKEVLPSVLSRDVVAAYSDIAECRSEVELSRTEMEHIHTDRDHWKSRCETALSDIEKERQEKFSVKFEHQEVSNQLRQQTEYCAAMGGACCTLLWRVSRCQESIQTLLIGAKVDDFLVMVASTLQSFVNTYKDELPQEGSEETQFILALCGIVTNIAASAFGRDFLMKKEQGKTLVDVFLSVLSETPNKQCGKLKNLILMGLFNISINQNGLRYLCTKPGILGLVAWHLQEENEIENRINSLKLVQSLLCNQESPTLLSEANEVLCPAFLTRIATDRNSTLREQAVELMADLRTLNDVNNSSDQTGFTKRET